jgi:branched-chain amino acid transport system ATP-binding protein
MAAQKVDMKPLVVRNLSRHFDGVRALGNVSLELEPGERRAIIGTNGAGKTTLFNIVNGQIPASSGEIWILGVDATRLPTHRRAALGLARTFQITSLLPRLSVLDNMIIAVSALSRHHFVFWRPVTRHPDILADARDLLQRWSLWALREEIVATLSYGVQRQLEIVMALAGRPRLLLLDEPMAGLSVRETHLASDIILNLDRTITVLMIEHDLAAAFRIADRITAMDLGEIVAEGTPDEIRRESSLRAIYQRGGATATPGATDASR